MKVVLFLKGAYGSPTFLADAGMVKVWYQSLKDLPFDDLRAAAQRHVATQKFPPSISDLRAASAGSKQDGAMQAWQEVIKAMSRSAYSAEQEFAALPLLSRRIIGSPNVLRSWGLTESGEVHTVIMSHFLKAWREESEKQRLIDLMPEPLKPQLSEQKTERISARAAEIPEGQPSEKAEGREKTKEEINALFNETMRKIRKRSQQRRREQMRKHGSE